MVWCDARKDRTCISATLGGSSPADLSLGIYGPGRAIGLAFLKSLTDRNNVKAHLLEPLSRLLAKKSRSLEELADNLPEIAPNRRTDLAQAAGDLLQGYTVLFLDDC